MDDRPPIALIRPWPLAFQNKFLEQGFCDATLQPITAADDRAALINLAITGFLLLNVVQFMLEQQYMAAAFSVFALYRVVPPLVMLISPPCFARWRRQLMAAMRICRILVHLGYVFYGSMHLQCRGVRQMAAELILSSFGFVVVFPTLSRDHDIVLLLLTCAMTQSIQGLCSTYVDMMWGC